MKFERNWVIIDLNVTTLILKLSISHFKMVMFLALHPMESISLNSFVLLEHLATRDDQKVRGKLLPFLHRLINIAGITANTTTTYMRLIGYNMFDVSRLCALQLSSRQRYIARTGPFDVVF